MDKPGNPKGLLACIIYILKYKGENLCYLAFVRRVYPI